MHLSRIVIRNVRSFEHLDVPISAATTCIIGENNTGKSNFLHAIRLCVDSGLSSIYRSLSPTDIHSTVDITYPNQVLIGLEITDFKGKTNEEALVGAWQCKPGLARLIYRGGLAIHEAFNLSSALNLAASYRHTYGHRGASGLPEVGPIDSSEAADNIAIDQNIMIAAPIWHDWAKTIVFQWTETGGEFPELNFGGNGKTDKFGGDGNSKTGADHILGVAETIKRGLPPPFVITQASAHAPPAEGNEFMVVNWIRAAAVIAQADPVAAGYLIKDPQGRPRLPPLRRLAELPIQQSLPDPFSAAIS
jgi:AAA ATPase domain